MDHKELDAWKEAMQLAEDIYNITKDFPQDERYGLTSQLRRAAVSVSANIAEGSPKGSDKDFIRYLHISLGGLAEVETLLLLSTRLNYLNTVESQKLVKSVNEKAKIIHGLIKYLKQKLK